MKVYSHILDLLQAGILTQSPSCSFSGSTTTFTMRSPSPGCSQLRAKHILLIDMELLQKATLTQVLHRQAKPFQKICRRPKLCLLHPFLSPLLHRIHTTSSLKGSLCCFSPLLFPFFWDRSLICSPGWSRTQYPPAFAS
jgi:hypothetical protein